jgi:hypothetical protein
MTRSLIAVQAEHLVAMMTRRSAGTWTASALQSCLDTAFDRPQYVHNVIAYARHKWGDDVVTCFYVPGTGYVYRLAQTAAEGYQYATTRKQKVRNECANLVLVLERVEAKWPGDKDVRVGIALLESVVRMMDAVG